jgi:uncharacterized membrane protein YbhN (UPF0104 family)
LVARIIVPVKCCAINNSANNTLERQVHDTLEREAHDTPERDAHRLRIGVLWAVVLAVLLVGIGLAIPNLRSVLNRAVNASWGWLVLGLALELASCIGYVGVVRLVLRRGPAGVVRRLAWAEMAFGAVVPVGGAGGLAVGAWAMRTWGAPWSRVANRSAVIFLLTSAVNAAVLGLAGIGVALGIGSQRSGLTYGLLPGGLALAALAAFLLFPLLSAPAEPRPHKLRHRVQASLHGLGVWVRDTESVAFAGDWRLIGALAYLLCDIAVLWACLRAVGLSAPILAVVVGYQLGYLANLLPVPGGIGVLDGGLLAALVLYKLPVAQAAAAVILYHAIALWLPTIGGTLGFVSLRRSLGLQHARRDERPNPYQHPSGAGRIVRSGDAAAPSSGAQLDAEPLTQATPSVIGDVHGAAACGGLDPAELKHPLGEGSPQSARQVVALLAPINAASSQRASPGLERRELDPERAQLGTAELGEAVVGERAVLGEPPSLEHRVQ